MYLIFFNLFFFFLEVCAIQHPTGFISLDECIQKGCEIKYCLEEGLSKQFVLTLENAIVVDEGAIVTNDGKILRDTETYKSDQQGLLRGNRNIAQEDSIYFDGKLAMISSPGQQCYYHWLLQVLPRLKILKEANIEYDQIYIYGNNYKHKWQKESLDIVLNNLDISPNKIFLIDKKDVIIHAKKLIIPSVAWCPSKNNFWQNQSLNWFKKFFEQTFIKYIINNNKRIFISRSKANYRRISNESEILKLLHKKRFVSVCLEDLSIYEQAALFNNAEIIIGPHGAGWTNLIFCRSKTKIIEIDHGIKGICQRSSYKDLSNFMNCEYHPFYVDFLEETDSPENINDPINQNLNVDVKKFEEFLTKLNI